MCESLGISSVRIEDMSNPNLSLTYDVHNSIKLINVERLELTFQIYLFYFVIIDPHHTTCNSIHDEVFGVKSMLQIWNFKLENLYYLLGSLCQTLPCLFCPAVWNSSHWVFSNCTAHPCMIPLYSICQEVVEN